MDKAFLLQLQEVSRSGALVLMGDFNHPDICWDSGMVGGRQSRRFLESVEDNFLVQVIDGQPKVKPYWTWCSSVQWSALERLRLEAVWAVVTMPGGVCDLEECGPGKKQS